MKLEHGDGLSAPIVLAVIVIELTFPLGMLVATPGAIEALETVGQSPEEVLARHAARDWGDLGEEDRRSNDAGVDNGERLLSAYCLADGTRIWIITEHDRSATTILLPSEY